MEFKKFSSTVAELRQPATPTTHHPESTTRFTLW
jgi:hypothetical protein